MSGSAACSSSIIVTPRRRAARVFAHDEVEVGDTEPIISPFEQAAGIQVEIDRLTACGGKPATIADQCVSRL